MSRAPAPSHVPATGLKQVAHFALHYVEMSAAMPILGLALLALGWTGALAMSSLALAEHALMMPAMLVPMLLDLRLYSGRGGHTPSRRAG